LQWAMKRGVETGRRRTACRSDARRGMRLTSLTHGEGSRPAPRRGLRRRPAAGGAARSPAAAQLPQSPAPASPGQSPASHTTQRPRCSRGW
jgi:hypothetical protein